MAGLMAKGSYKEYVSKAFSPLMRAAQRDDLSGKLRALPPPAEIQQEQFAKFRNLKPVDFPATFLPNGGFFIPFDVEGARCFAFSSFLDREDLHRALDRWLERNEALLSLVDQATFLFVSYHAHQFYGLREEFRNRRAAESVLEICLEDDYAGHDLNDLISYHQPTYVISLPSDSLLGSIHPLAVASELLSLIDPLRSPIIDREFCQLILPLLAKPAVSVEGIFSCLNSSRWRYVYLELFRIIEAVLHVPWMVEFQQKLDSNAGVKMLYASVRETLEWREAKGRSVERLFLEIDNLMCFATAAQGIESLKECSGATDKPSSYARKIYKIRNQLVHPEDYTDSSVLSIGESEFRELSVFLCKFAERIYDKYNKYLN